MMNQMMNDDDVRVLAIDPTKSYIVTAPAGSGKTALMIQRILRILAEDEKLEKPDQLVAITFTNAAADELRVRLLTKLDEARKNEKLDEANEYEVKTRELANAVMKRDAKEDWKLLEIPERLKICTIDAFCKEVLTHHAQRTGLGTVPSVADPEGETTEVYREAAKMTLETSGRSEEEGNRINRFLKIYGYNRRLAIDDLSKLLAAREQWRDAVKRVDESTNGDVEFCIANAKRVFAELSKIVDFEKVINIFTENNCLNEVIHFCKQAQEHGSFKTECYKCLEDKNAENLVTDLCEEDKEGLLLGFKQLLFSGDEYRKTRGITVSCGFPKEAEAKKERQNFATRCMECRKCKAYFEGINIEIVEAYSVARKDAKYSTNENDRSTDFKSLLAVVGVLPILLKSLEDQWIARGVLDFTAVADKAVEALGELTDKENRTRHLMVDEFQDSSKRQYQLIKAITRQWKSRNDGRTLFVVGDPMQSIYRFRQAEVELFINACQSKSIGDFEVDDTLTLNKNFRSRKSLVEWYNGAFSHILGDVASPETGAVRYTQAVGVRDDDAETTENVSCRKDVYTLEDKDDKKAMADRSLWHVAQLVKEWTEQHPAADDDAKCAILVRNRNYLGNVLSYLRKEGIPYQAIEIDKMNKRQVIIDLISLTRALCMENDTVAWLSLLRAPWCGLTLAQLEQFTPNENKSESKADNAEDATPADVQRTVWEKIEKLKDSPEFRDTRLRSFYDVMFKSHAAALQASQFTLLVEQTWLELGGPATVEDESDLEGVRQYLNILYKLEQDGHITSNERLVAAVEHLYAPPDQNADAQKVQVMTIHKSKGMEFDTVILPTLDKSAGGRDSTALLKWCWIGNQFVCAAGKVSQEKIEDAKESLYYKALVSLINKRKEENESRRLLYVAATRAKNCLRMVYGYKENQSPNLFATMIEGIETPKEDITEMVKNSQNDEALDVTQDFTDAGKKVARLSKDWELEIDDVAIPEGTIEGADDGDAVDDEHYSVGDKRRIPDWLGKFAAGSPARAIGTVVHAWLERMAKDGTEKLIDDDDKLIRTALRQNKVYREDELNSSEKIVKDALQHVIQEHPEMLRRHDEDYYEYALTSPKDNRFQNKIIDRLWRKGSHWTIVDYKTTNLEGDSEEHLTDKISGAEYDKQVIEYGEIIQKRFNVSSSEVSRYLYFPLMNKLAKIPEDGEITIVDRIEE
ncbi:UvrD-helicase domain-containing protein [Candidatus Sumerlaeota bacterium]|nr:UvrD-helicase domain-containing protein [Candidatus Sumerlaeota bacterium]